MRTRCSARLIVMDATQRILLFRFEHKTGPLAGQEYWATPGGGLEHGESYEQAAVRELREETGIAMLPPDWYLAERRFTLQLPDGENVIAEERYFFVRTSNTHIRDAEWTSDERQFIVEHKWWSLEELRSTDDIVWPNELLSWVRAILEMD
ncbi:NUDIX domain-containing protein [Herbaspirillum sp. 3R11]|nr:NUDIX domain-containing protein [Herbaspirillum sp. 3R-3a1]TFI09117.1 NUDIX domain-containing protein [Herbaspirillum sp. 3R11]TFI15535.1 NUDIX domain-containing protein [Herbaspirillum sp. 3R-11]TFI32051.1 NUDIX domain-containing protein [Herbaspirillum sp. 3C11]TFI32064.1 NUDIX domain-containing protein [Herbaspirillum sp. 3C11]